MAKQLAKPEAVSPDEDLPRQLKDTSVSFNSFYGAETVDISKRAKASRRCPVASRDAAIEMAFEQ